jgi:hypothetical protein
MCGRHETSKNEQPRATNSSMFSPPLLLRRQGYFITFVDEHLRLRELVFEMSSSAILHWKRVNKVFGKSLYDCSITSPSSSSQLVYLFIDRARSLVASTVNFIIL